MNLKHVLKAELEAMGKRASNNEGMGDGLFKLPDDFAQRLDEIKLLKAALEELMRNFKNVIAIEHAWSFFSVSIYIIYLYLRARVDRRRTSARTSRRSSTISTKNSTGLGARFPNASEAHNSTKKRYKYVYISKYVARPVDK